MAKDKSCSNSDQLKNTLETLEKALTEWEQIIPDEPATPPEKTAECARQLLEKLKKQLQTF